MKRRGAKRKRKRGVSQSRKARLDKLVAEAIVDCYDESEQVTGLYTMIENCRSKQRCSEYRSRCNASS
jgi:hypothetical protein